MPELGMLHEPEGARTGRNAVAVFDDDDGPDPTALATHRACHTTDTFAPDPDVTVVEAPCRPDQDPPAQRRRDQLAAEHHAELLAAVGARTRTHSFPTAGGRHGVLVVGSVLARSRR